MSIPHKEGHGDGDTGTFLLSRFQRDRRNVPMSHKYLLEYVRQMYIIYLLTMFFAECSCYFFDVGVLTYE